MKVERRTDDTPGFVWPTFTDRAQPQDTLDAAIAEMLDTLKEIGRRLDALEAKREAAQKAKYLAALRAHLDERFTRADFFDDRTRRFTP